jgi:hypothetical protein
MPNELWRIVDEVTYRASRLDWQQWVTLSLLVLVVGLFSMRGFGSRQNY